MVKGIIAISSFISIFTALAIDIIALSDTTNIFNFLNYFNSLTSSTFTPASFSTGIISLLCFLAIYIITDAITSIIIITLKRTDRRERY
jgi:hypothetical protein